MKGAFSAEGQGQGSGPEEQESCGRGGHVYLLAGEEPRFLLFPRGVPLQPSAWGPDHRRHVASVWLQRAPHTVTGWESPQKNCHKGQSAVLRAGNTPQARHATLFNLPNLSGLPCP